VRAQATAAPRASPLKVILWAFGGISAVIVLVSVGSAITNPQGFCGGYKYGPRRVPPPPGQLWYTTAGVEARGGPGPEHPVVRRLPPGAELRAMGGDPWVRATTAAGAPLGYLPAAALAGTPPTLEQLRAMAPAERAALERELLAGIERTPDSTVVRYRPAAAPDWRRLHRWMETFVQPSPLQDTVWRYAILRPEFALYGEVEEEADSVRLVLVAGERARDAFWTRVTFVPPPAVPDSSWPSYLYPRLTTGARRTDEEPYLHIRFLAVPADSSVRATAWRVASRDSVQMRFTGGACVLPYLIPEQEKEQLRRVLRLYELKKAVLPRGAEMITGAAPRGR
jgi:hypothetical protein